MYGHLIKALNLNNADVLNVYPFGSRVYGTNSHKSDYDYIVVGNTYIKPIEIDCLNLKGEYLGRQFSAIVYDTQSFSQKLKEHSISAMECIFLPEELLLLNTAVFSFTPNKTVLANNICRKSRLDFEKAEVRFTAGSLEKAKKSLFHAMRVLDFGTQITKHGKILDYQKCGEIYFELINNPSQKGKDYLNLWEPRFYDRLEQFKRSIQCNQPYTNQSPWVQE